MHINPRRRRRALRVHHLTQRDKSQKEIARLLNVSRATVRADLQLVESHWSSIASAAADDLLLQSLHLLQLRLTLALKTDEVARQSSRLTPSEYLRARDDEQTRLNALAREIRRTTHEIQRRAEQRPDQPELYDEQPEDPAAMAIVEDVAETSTESAKTAPPDPTISSPEREIVESHPEPEKIPAEPDLAPLIAEAVQHFPQLKGQSPEQILHFLDQVTHSRAA